MSKIDLPCRRQLGDEYYPLRHFTVVTAHRDALRLGLVKIALIVANPSASGCGSATFMPGRSA